MLSLNDFLRPGCDLLVIVVVEGGLGSRGPKIPEQTDGIVKPSNGVSSHDSNRLSAIESKVPCKEVCRHLAISDGIGVTFNLGGLVWFVANVL